MGVGRLAPRVADPEPVYPGGLVPTVLAFLEERARRAMAAGIPSDAIILDAGLDLGKTPRMSLELHELASKGDYANLKKLMNEYVIPLYLFRNRRHGYEVSVMKEMMMQIGLVAGPVRPPLLDPTAEEKAEIRAMLERWKPWL